MFGSQNGSAITRLGFIVQDTECQQRIIDKYNLEIERLRLLSLVEEDTSSGAIIGVIISACILVAVVAAASVYVYLKRKKNRKVSKIQVLEHVKEAQPNPERTSANIDTEDVGEIHVVQDTKRPLGADEKDNEAL